MKKQKREIKNIDLNLVKLLFQEVQMRYNDPLCCYSDFLLLSISISAKAYPQREFLVEEDCIVHPKTLYRYWCSPNYGSGNRRYSPDEIVLDRMAEYCDYKNWSDFIVKNKGREVVNILPYEANIDYFREGIMLFDSLPENKSMYFGNESKYIGIMVVNNNVVVIDFKNVSITSYIHLLIEGIQVMPGNTNFSIIRLINN